MKDYTLSQSWKGSHATEMQDLTFSRPDDIFIFTRFSSPSPCAFEGKQILFAEDLTEAAGYIRYIFLCDIFRDINDDMRFDPETVSEELNSDSVSVLCYAHLLEKAMKAHRLEELFDEFREEFNKEFSHRDGCEYEFHILKGIDELKAFLFEYCEKHPKYNIEKLSNLCSKDLFAGKPLKDYIDTLLYT